MAARLIRTWFEDLCQLKPGAVATLILCGIMLGAVIALCMHKPPGAGSRSVQSSSGQVHAACQPGARRLLRHFFPSRLAKLSLTVVRYPETDYCQTAPNAYNILVPDWGGSNYRPKTIVNQ